MTIFERTLRRELISAAGAVFITLLMITITFMLSRILTETSEGQVASQDVLILIGFTSLDFFPTLLILTGFVSVLLVVTRSYQDSEMVVWFASGMSLTRWIKPVMSVGIPLILIIAAFSLVISPWANEQNLEVKSRFEKREDIAKIAPGKFQEFRGSRVSFVEEVSGDLSKIQNIFINLMNNGRNSIIVAKEGHIEIDARGDRFLVMHQGRRYDGLPNEGDFQMMQFEKYSQLLSAQSAFDANNVKVSALPLKTLIDEPSNSNDGELIWRVSRPIMALLLMLLAIPLGFVNPRVGRSANVIAALILVAINLNALKTLELAVRDGRLSFWHASWPMHAVVLVMIVMFFMWRLQINSRFHPSGVWTRVKACFYIKRNERVNCANANNIASNIESDRGNQ